MSDAKPNIQTIFCEALEKESPEELQDFLDAACRDDAELRAQVEQLLESHQVAGKFLGGAAPLEVTQDIPPITEKPGTVVGPYKLLQQIGEGGMGVVYMAEQSEPVERRVALKIIKPGMDTRQVIARFEAERQALAMMDHPNISKVLDAGATDSGRPYFVMELVKGIPLTKYCDEQHLTPKERLELFIPICQAVQHAHQKGIIHRDIKPSNILVALYDGQPVPKVIDFGVAKATSHKLTEKTMFTQYGQIVGTLEYMSPEQANLNQLDIDTRSDIYSLGVLLYELLTGATPFDKERLRSAAFEEMMRIIREEEPPRPSLRLSTIDTLPSVAANRKIEPKKLSVLVRGELDWIVMKALEKDRARRYETATGFANDIQRYLNDEAVVACPPSRAYRFRKFASRNKAAFSTVALVAVALLLGIAGTTLQAVRATKAESLAQERYGKELKARRRTEEQRDRAIAAEEEAETEAAISEAVNKFLNDDLLSQADPKKEPDRDIKLRTVVDRAAERIEGRFAKQPLVEAAIRETIGRTYLSLWEFEKAQHHHERARELRENRLGKEHIDTLSSMVNVGNAIYGQGQYAEAERLIRELLEISQRVLGPEHRLTLGTMNNLAATIEEQGRSIEAEPLFRDLLEIQQRVLGPEHPDTLMSMFNVAQVHSDQGQYEEAEKLDREVLVIRQRVLGPEHPDTLMSIRCLASDIGYQSRYSEAEKLTRDLLEILQRVLGPEHPNTLSSMRDLANALGEQGDVAEAEPLLRELLEIQQRVLGPEHPDTLVSMHDLASAITGQGDLAEAEELLREALEIQKRVLGLEHQNTLAMMGNLARVDLFRGRYDEAEKLYREVLEIQQRVLGLKHRETLASMNNIAQAIMGQSRYNEAEKLSREVLEIRQRVQGPEHPETRRTKNNLVNLYTTWCWRLATLPDDSDRDPAKAVELANLAIELQPDVANHWNNLGVAQYRAGDFQAAAEALEKTDAMIEGGDRAHRMFYAMAHWQLGDKEKARELYAQGSAWIASHAQDNEELNRFRAEAEELMSIAEEDRKRLIEEYNARRADETSEAPNEKPSDNGTEAGDHGPEEVKPEEQDADP